MLEGVETEPNYFVRLFDTKKFYNIDFRYFQKENKEKCWSNPKLLFDFLLTFVSNSSDKMTFGDIKRLVFNELNNSNDDLDYSSFKIEFNKLQRNENINNSDIFNKEQFDSILQELKNTSFKNILYNDFDVLIQETKELLNIETYDLEIDKLVLIVDRDRQSFSSKQYQYILNKIQDCNIKFIVTNPCFEFYLALHIDNCKDANISCLLENKIEDNNFSFHIII